MNIKWGFITIFLLLIYLNGKSQNGSIDFDKKITRDIVKDINSLIPTGEINVDIMDQITASPRRIELQNKFYLSVKKYPEWFAEQQKLAETTGKSVEYDPRFGLTEQEWEEYKSFSIDMSDIKAISSGKSKVEAFNNEGIISFTADEELSYLNSFTIDIKNNIVKMDDYLLMPSDTINVMNANHVFKTKWKGYRWQYRESNLNGFPTSKKELENASIIVYSFTLELFEKTGQTYMEIAGHEINNGKESIEYKIPIVF